MTISDYTKKYGQTATARALGVTQGAVWQMIRSGRTIFVVETNTGIQAYEIKLIGRRAKTTLSTDTIAAP